ncbi:MAG TPA: HIT family protein [Patescibacteria group bacterium]
MDCIFCKIIAGDIPADIIYEDNKVLAFMDIRPVSRGHALVVPKVHGADIVDTDDAAISDAILQAKRIAVAIQHALQADGFTISTNRGEAAGQTVFHLHFHIIPRYRKDGLQPWPHQEIAPKTRSEIAGEIKKHL